MGIERLTTNLGMSILEVGTPEWGTFTNANLDLIDSAIGLDRERISALENINAILPAAIAKRIGHNLLRNNIFALGTASAPEVPILWTTQFLNGAVGNSARTPQTTLVGTHSFRITIASVNTSPSFQQRPYPGLNVLDPADNSPVATFDPRQLTNGFGYSFQTVTLLPSTVYTVSAHGKADISNLSLGINCHWKVGIVFKSTGNTILHSHFSQPQTNRTNNLASSSFERASITFTTPNLPVVTAEVWLVSEGSIPAGIGSCWFDGIQIEQASEATMLDTFSMKEGSLFVDGDLIVGGNLTLQQENLVFDSELVTFTGSVQIGDDITNDTLDVYTKASTFHGPLSVEGYVTLGNDAVNDKVEVIANKTIFYNDQNPSTPQGGNVEIQGDLLVLGSLTLGNNVTQDVVTINANLVTLANDLDVGGDVDISGYFKTDRGVILGSNNPFPSPYDTLVVKMQDGGSFFEGDVTLEDDLFVKGNTILGDSPTDNVSINAGLTSLQGSLYVDKDLTVQGASLFNIGSGSGDNFTVIANDFLITSTGNTEIDTSNLNITGFLTLDSGNTASISNVDVSFGLPSSPLSTFDVYSSDSYFLGDMTVGEDLDVNGNITAQGDTFVLGSMFSISPSGEITIGDQDAYVGDLYDNTLRVYAGNTFFGSYGSQTKGNVEVGGFLKVGGDLTLGNGLDDTIAINAASLNLNLAPAGLLNIGGGFQNNTYNPAASDHGGSTFDNKGNLFIDGKLTVKGPIDPTQLIIDPRQTDGFVITNVVDAIKISAPTLTPNTTFRVTSSGAIYAEQLLNIDDGYVVINNTNVNFGKSDGYLTSYSLYSNNTNLYSDVSILGSLNVGNLNATDTSISGDLSLTGSLTVAQDIVSNGTNFAFGAAPALTTTFDVRAHTIYLGKDGQNIGNVTVGNNLYVRKDLTVGFPGQYNNNVNLSAHTYNVDVASYKPGSIELAGFRVGGGYQNNPYDALVLDHGGVTIDAYGNIFADGRIISKGPLGFDSLILTVPVGGMPSNPIFQIINDSTGDGYLTFNIDGYGNTTTETLHVNNYATIDGYLCFSASNMDDLELGTGLGEVALDSYIVFCVDKQILPTYGGPLYGGSSYGNSNTRVLDIDNFGNLRSYSYIHTTEPGKSNLATYSVTVGDGFSTFGDFNSTGPVEAFANPLQEAVNELALSGGTIFLKRGTYTLNSNLTLPANVSIKGEGESSIIDGAGLYGIIVNGNGVRIEDLKIQNMTTGITVNATRKRAKLEGLFITLSSTGVQLDGDECVVSNCFVTDNTTNGIVVTGSNNAVATNVVVRNP
jgi:predicted acyltransferase (DUF342 family)